MPRRCHLTGTHSHSGQNVSHSNRKSKRRFEPNLQHAHLHSDALRRTVHLRVSTHSAGGVPPRTRTRPRSVRRRNSQMLIDDGHSWLRSSASAPATRLLR